MSRKRRGRFRQSDIDRLKKATKEYNRILKKVTTPETREFLPPIADAKAVLSTITTKSELLESIASLNRFNIKAGKTFITSEKGVTRTIYEIEETQRKIERINKQRRKRIKETGISPETGTMRAMQAENLREKVFNFESITNWDKFVHSVEKQVKSTYFKESDEIYKENWIRSVDERITLYARGIINVVRNIPASQFVMAALSDPLLDIDYTYDPHSQQEKAFTIMERLSEHFGIDIEDF